MVFAYFKRFTPFKKKHPNIDKGLNTLFYNAFAQHIALCVILLCLLCRCA